jgi:hypothetical protein
MIEEQAAVDGASRDQAKIPDVPPERPLAEATGANAGPSLIQVVGANPLTMK